MAKVFNGNMWAGIGNNITAQRAYKDKRAEDGFNGLMSVASGIETMNANNNMRNAILDYYKQKQDASDVADAYDVESQLAREQAIYDLANMDDSDLLETAELYNDDGTLNMGSTFEKLQSKGIPFYTAEKSTEAKPDEFLESYYPGYQNFNPNTASIDDIKKMQRMIGVVPDGIWGAKSQMAYNKYMGA